MLTGIRRLITEVAARYGYVVTPDWRLRDEEMRRHLKAIFSVLDIDCVFDVGANLGQYARFIRGDVGYKGLIVSVEPIAAHVEVLRAAAASDPLWLIEAIALGAAPGRLPINVARAGDLSSFLQPHMSNATGFAESAKATSIEEVEVRTFDDLFASVRERYNVRNIYLKLDTQGFDLNVLQGVADVTPIRGLQSEMSVVPIYEGMPDYLTSLRAFADRGFIPSAMFPINATTDGRLIEFDCVMVASGQSGQPDSSS